MTYNPWRELRRYPEIELLWTADDDYLDGADALWFPDTKEIVMDSRLRQVSKRCALAHELAHIVRHDGPCVDQRAELRQELAADRLAARWLIPDMHTMAEAMKRTVSNGHAAQELWVTLHMFEVRLHSLHASEYHQLKDLLSDPGDTV
ncbi:hypothetical protein GCM10022234_00830 [Aeromicrobium panaciterrae]|uniref:ImmA/IrrE family metallo-endopeptidase n=1 Tax=Aeromicrobium panaciterrae TaxID=363861 RepID=UPI0031E42C92